MPEFLPRGVGYIDSEWRLNERKTAGEAFGGSLITDSFNAGTTDYWSGTLTTQPMKGATLNTFGAWAVNVGKFGEFYMYNTDQPRPLNSTLADWYAGSEEHFAGSTDIYAGAGELPGTGSVNGAGQTGSTLVTDNWAQASTQIMDAGDYFGVGDHLYLLTADATTNASNQVTLQFSPPLKSSPADNADVITHYPKMIAHLLFSYEFSGNRNKVAQPLTFPWKEKI